jgi:hypothetical protein
MNTPFAATPIWSTSSLGDTVDTSPMELTALGQHLDLCAGSRGRWFKVQCVAEAMNGFIAPRLVTTLVIVTLLLVTLSFGVSSLAMAM